MTGDTGSAKFLQGPGRRGQLSLRVADDAGRLAAARVLGVEPPRQPCTWRVCGNDRTGRSDVLAIGPDEWLVVTSLDTRADVESALSRAVRGLGGAVVDVSAQRSILELADPPARDLLASGCALDLHPRAFPDGACASVLFAGVPVILQASPGAVRLYVRPSFGEHVERWLRDAAALSDCL